MVSESEPEAEQEEDEDEAEKKDREPPPRSSLWSCLMADCRALSFQSGAAVVAARQLLALRCLRASSPTRRARRCLRASDACRFHHGEVLLVLPAAD